MNDSYKELMVKKESGLKEKLLRVVCLIPTIFLGLLTLLTGNMIIFIIVIFVNCYFFVWFLFLFHCNPVFLSLLLR